MLNISTPHQLTVMIWKCCFALYEVVLTMAIRNLFPFFIDNLRRELITFSGHDKSKWQVLDLNAPDFV